MLLRERGSVGYRVLRRDRPVGLDRERQPVVVRALPDARLGNGKVGAPHRIVDRVDADHIHGHGAVERMLLGLHVAASLVDVQLTRDVPVVLQREEELVRVHDRDRAVGLDVASIHGPRLAVLDVEHRLVHVGGDHQRQLLQPLDDLVDVLDDSRDGLVLVHHAVQAERPDRRAAQRGQQHSPERVAEGVAVAALQWLEPELGRVRVVLPLGHLHQVGPDEPGQIESRHHLE